MDLDAEVPDRESRERWLLKRKTFSEEGRLAPEEFELKANNFKNGGAAHMLGYARLLSLSGGEEFDRRVTGTYGKACREFSSPPRCEQPLSLENEKAALRRCLRA